MIKNILTKIYNRITRVFGKKNYLPPANLRTVISELYLAGDGIEIGAMNNPLIVNTSKAFVKYVDRMSKEDLQKHYDKSQGIIDIDIIDDGEKLCSISGSSLDFIIANHMIEHCRNPISTLDVFLDRLKPNGIIYLAAPNKCFTFDAKRELTSFEHLADDYRLGDNTDDHFHYADWSRHCDNVENENEIEERIVYLRSINYSIHYHVWDNNTFLDFLIRSNDLLSGRFIIELYVLHGSEIITILRKK